MRRGRRLVGVVVAGVLYVVNRSGGSACDSTLQAAPPCRAVEGDGLALPLKSSSHLYVREGGDGGGIQLRPGWSESSVVGEANRQLILAARSGQPDGGTHGAQFFGRPRLHGVTVGEVGE